jgi:hypothetical protein
VGALATLYDVTALYPGTPGTGLDGTTWENLSTTLLWGSDIPLNLVNSSALEPGSENSPNVMPESQYAANTSNPWIAPASVTVGNLTLQFLGRHYFDSTSTPTFNLSAAGLVANVNKTGTTNAPADANKGILDTGAVAWLQLQDSGRGISQGISEVYRVVTAGGNAEPCSTSGAGSGSVPYTAFYWYFG